jgi:TLC domain
MWSETSRSDFLEMTLHHVATIALISLSYLTSFTRIGASILIVHDIADIFLESAKCFNYTSKVPGRKWASTVCDSLFAVFAVAFFVTRLVIYPRYLVYSLLYEAPEVMGMWGGWWVFAILLSVLQCLHVFWFALIVKMIYRLLTTGIEKDERSDDEADLSDDEKSTTVKSSADSSTTPAKSTRSTSAKSKSTKKSQ